LTLDEVSYRYAGADGDALHDLCLRLDEGTITGLVGPSEAGKSTLCLVLGGLAPRVIGGHLRGSLRIDGQDVAGWPMHRITEQVVLGLQDPGGQLSLVAETVYEEVAFGPRNLGLARGEIMARTEEALERLGLVDLTSRDPRLLSGGQQQLVALAGLLAMRPRLLVLDEPLAHLDALSTERAMAALTDLAAAGSAVLIAESRTDPLATHCATVAALAAGRLVRVGPAVEVLTDTSVLASGVEEPAALRLGRLLTAAATHGPGPSA
jgi:energy-coupling factor transporter ATP-binding protein EcfA2